MPTPTESALLIRIRQLEQRIARLESLLATDSGRFLDDELKAYGFR